MPELSFQVESAEAVPFGLAPTLALKLRVRSADDSAQIHSVALRCQVRIDPALRTYTALERPKLLDLFGEPSRWRTTLRSMLWSHVNLFVPAFRGATVVDVPLPCSFDFALAATKYFDALAGGEIPLTLLFSGSVFHAGEDGLQVAPISWSQEASYRLPVQVWKEMIQQHYPNTAWLCLRRDAFDRLHEYKLRMGIPTWELAVERLIEAATEGQAW